MNRSGKFAAALAVAAAMVPFGVTRAQGSGFRERVDTTVSIERGGTLSVSVYSGRVSVTGVNGSNVRIQGTVERGEMTLRERAGAVTVNTEPDGPRGGSADLDITVPIGTTVLLEGFSAPFVVKGVKGEVKIETLSGSIQVTDAIGNVNLGAVSGDIDARNIAGDLRVEAVSGRVSITNVDGDVDAESVSGSIAVTGARSKSVRTETVSGNVSYDGSVDPSGSYVFRTHSGRLTMGLPPGAGATVSLETFSGNVESDFPVTMESGKSRMGHESKFEFRIGNGRSRIVAETFSGNIRIQRSTSTR